MEESRNHREISPEEEIRQLEERLAIKKKELEDKGEAKQEKEIFKEVLKEHIEEIRPGPNLAVPGGAPSKISDDAAKAARKLKDDEEKSQLEALVAIALGESLLKAVHIAEALGPYMLDLLHDTLVDHYYEKLVAARKINIS